jgi:hypothetical protein
MRRWIYDEGIEFIKFARKLTLSCRDGDYYQWYDLAT